jgi:O-acetyl-ADP-ribose deacetylase
MDYQQPLKQIFSQIKILHDDICLAKVDAIVNAANEHLIPGGGVDGAIHCAAGPELAKAVRTFRHCPTGQAVITPGFKLNAKYVIHAVGPIWDEAKNPTELKRLLKHTYQAIFSIAIAQSCQSIAIPNISTGVYAFPKEEAARIAIETTLAFLSTTQSKIKVYFYCYDQQNYDIYHQLLKSESL